MQDLIYYSELHRKDFLLLLEKMASTDPYHTAVAYLFSMDSVCAEHINDIFDFKDDAIKPDCFGKGWQTGTSKKTVRLAFNLWNNYSGQLALDDESINDAAEYYSVSEIFCCSYAPYYWQAIRLRYPEYGLL